MAGLRVGVDARTGADRGTGVATYAAALIQTLDRSGAEVVRVTDLPSGEGPGPWLRRWIAAAAPNPHRLQPASGPQGGRSWIGPDLFRRAQVHFNLHGRLLELDCPDPPDLMHWTYPLPLMMRGTRNLYTVHDAIPWDHPDLTGIDPTRHARLLDRISRVADAILTVSEHSRIALAPRLAGLRGPLCNTYQAPLDPPAAAPLPEGLVPGGYLLFCGQIEPRKNLARLVEAHRLSGSELTLVIAGPDGWRAGEALRAVPPRVMRLPWVERPQLAALLSQARALVFPSLAEGFGLPVLEAMALGIPVATSNRGALAEIAADAALTVPPEDMRGLAEALRALSEDEGLCEALSRRGRARAALFSQDAYSRRLKAAYTAALAAPRHV